MFMKMEAEVYVYCVALPEGVREMVAPCAEGYTIYLDKNLGMAQRQAAYEHAMYHIKNNDLEGGDIQMIEYAAHYDKNRRTMEP